MDSELLAQLKNIKLKIKLVNDKINSATKFIDFFVHDLLDYAILQKKKNNFIKDLKVFDVKEAI